MSCVKTNLAELTASRAELCPGGQKMEVGHAARQGLADLLGYCRSFYNVLSIAGKAYGLGVAWGENLSPADSTEIALCDGC